MRYIRLGSSASIQKRMISSLYWNARRTVSLLLPGQPHRLE
jgi:hypothetical protein